MVARGEEPDVTVDFNPKEKDDNVGDTEEIIEYK